MPPVRGARQDSDSTNCYDYPCDEPGLAAGPQKHAGPEALLPSRPLPRATTSARPRKPTGSRFRRRTEPATTPRRAGKWRCSSSPLAKARLSAIFTGSARTRAAAGRRSMAHAPTNMDDAVPPSPITNPQTAVICVPGTNARYTFCNYTASAGRVEISMSAPRFLRTALSAAC